VLALTKAHYRPSQRGWEVLSGKTHGIDHGIGSAPLQKPAATRPFEGTAFHRKEKFVLFLRAMSAIHTAGSDVSSIARGGYPAPGVVRPARP
jgi:hypothetical protein